MGHNSNYRKVFSGLDSNYRQVFSGLDSMFGTQFKGTAKYSLPYATACARSANTSRLSKFSPTTRPTVSETARLLGTPVSQLTNSFRSSSTRVHSGAPRPRLSRHFQTRLLAAKSIFSSRSRVVDFARRKPK